MIPSPKNASLASRAWAEVKPRSPGCVGTGGPPVEGGDDGAFEGRVLTTGGAASTELVTTTARGGAASGSVLHVSASVGWEEVSSISHRSTARNAVIESASQTPATTQVVGNRTALVPRLRAERLFLGGMANRGAYFCWVCLS
jgi:hypothetical protein